jgi:hypothetical protein
MERKIECTCGHQHLKTFETENDWKCIKKTCCPICTADLPENDNPIWDDENFWQAATTGHKPVLN